MPSKNIIKQYGADQFYHIYSRGVAKQTIFADSQDYNYFLSLFKRYLSTKPTPHKSHPDYPCYHGKIELITYCLMPNHIHMLIFQHNDRAMVSLMHSVLTSYCLYFNKKYDRVGPVFQSRYKASLIIERDYLEHISRYIHMNPKDWQLYKYSSLPNYKKERISEWLNPSRILNIFNSPKEYVDFLETYESQKRINEHVKKLLAND